MGLHHSGSWDCTGAGGQAVTLSSTCNLNEYNDPFDVMGAWGSRHNSGWHLQQLGLLQSSNVQTITDPGVYSMTAALDQTTQATTLRIPRTRAANGSVTDWYYLETRKSGGVFDNFSLSDWIVKGVSIRVNDDPALATRSKLLDTHPATNINDAALQPGETFSDGQISVTTLSAGNGTATVQIALQPQPADGQAPTVPTGLSHVLTGGGVRLQWSASTDNVGVSAYMVYRDGVQVGSAAVTSYDDTTVLPGQHVYTVYAQDGAGNRSAASAPHTVTEPRRKGAAAAKHAARDRRGPRVRLARHRLRGGRLLLAASARDEAGVARVSLWIDGRRVTWRKASRLRYRWRLHVGRHRIVVKAVDRKGNVSTLERRLRVTGRR
jgi:hypothetical protein